MILINRELVPGNFKSSDLMNNSTISIGKCHLEFFSYFQV